MNIKETVVRGFKIAAGNMNIVMILFAVSAVWNVINVFLAPKVQAPGANPDIAASVAIVVVGIVFLFVSIYVQTGSMGYVQEVLKTGKADLGVFNTCGAKYYGKILLLGLLLALVIGVLVIFAALAVALFGKTAQVVGVIIALILASVAIYCILMILFAPYAIVAGNAKVIEAVKQSITLVRRNMLTVVGTLLLLVLIGFGMGFGIGVVIGLMSLMLKGTASQVLFGVVSAFMNGFLGMVVTGSLMKLYLEVSNNTGGAN